MLSRGYLAAVAIDGTPTPAVCLRMHCKVVTVMRMPRFVTAAVVLVLIGLGVSRSVDALSCIPLADVVARMDVIVRGTITAIPETRVLELAVSRYYKGGSGPAQVRAEVASLGQGQRMDWYSLPKVGDELIIGFVNRGDSLVNEACHLFVQLEGGQAPPEDIKTLIGEGQAPDRGEQPHQVHSPGTAEPELESADPARNALMWASAAGLMIIGLASWMIWRWRRRTT